MESDSDQEVFERNNDFSHRLIENQQIGFKLAEEVRRLREELLHEKQEKRILLISNQNLQSQLNIVEERMKKLEVNDVELNRKLVQVEKDLEYERKQKDMFLSDCSKLRTDRSKLKSDLDHEMRKLFELSLQLEETLKNVEYWKECVKTYEISVKELSQEKHLQDAKVSEHQRFIAELQQKLSQMQSKTNRFFQCCTEILPLKEIQTPVHLSDISFSNELDLFPVILKGFKYISISAALFP